MWAQLIKTIVTQDVKWLCIKLFLALQVFSIMGIMIFSSHGCPLPTGICKLYSFDPLFTEVGKVVLLSSFIVLYLLYLLEIRMVVVTFLLFLLSCIIISYHESNGIFFRATILTVISGAVFIAYFRRHFNPTFNLSKYRIQYGLQVIAATYTLAGIAKARASGLGWFNDGGNFSLQIAKNYAYQFYDTGMQTYIQQGDAIAYGFLHHLVAVKVLLAISLFLEITCFLALVNSKLRVAYGIGLLGMHIGIKVFMGIGMSVIATPMIAFFLNPLYLIILLVQYLRGKKANAL